MTLKLTQLKMLQYRLGNIYSLLFLIALIFNTPHLYSNIEKTNIPLFWWQPEGEVRNFGDELSCAIVEKLLGFSVQKPLPSEKKLLALGSILHFASENDVIWGSGINGKHLNAKDYPYTNLDIRCVRGPLTREFLKNLGIEAPEVYGDPGLLVPLLFPEIKKKKAHSYIIIPHMSETKLFYGIDNVVNPTAPWKEVVQNIVNSNFVISSSLHGLIIAEAYGIPARLLKITHNEPLFKYRDYYLSTGRKTFKAATSIREALKLKGEPPAKIDYLPLLLSFPYDLFHQL